MSRYGCVGGVLPSGRRLIARDDVVKDLLESCEEVEVLLAIPRWSGPEWQRVAMATVSREANQALYVYGGSWGSTTGIGCWKPQTQCFRYVACTWFDMAVEAVRPVVRQAEAFDRPMKEDFLVPASTRNGMTMKADETRNGCTKCSSGRGGRLRGMTGDDALETYVCT